MIDYKSCIGEKRLLMKGDLRQLGGDIRDFHINTDGPIETAGSVVMAPAVGIAKIGNAIAGEFSSEAPVPLGEGGLKYTEQGIKSLALNTWATIRNLFGHPIKSVGNAIKVAFDAADTVLINPAIDVFSNAFGHISKTRTNIYNTLAPNH